MLRAEGLEVWRGQTQVLSGMSLSLRTGAVTALLGGNGSGKSTTLYALSGLAPVRSGHVWLGEKEITGLSPREVVKAGIGHVPQGREVFPTLSVKENLFAGAAVLKSRAQRDRQVERVLEIFPMLRERLRSRSRRLERRRAAAGGDRASPDPGSARVDDGRAFGWAFASHGRYAYRDNSQSALTRTDDPAGRAECRPRRACCR